MVPLPGCGARALPLPPRHPDAPGPRRRTDPLLGHRGSGKGDPEQHALRYDAREHRGDRCRSGRSRHRRGPGTPAYPSIQREHGPRGARRAAGEARRRRPGGLRHRHEQLRRGTAGLDGEHPLSAGGVRSLSRAVLSRRVPLRRERVVHPHAREGLRGQGRSGHRARDGVIRGRDDDEREEGSAGEHRRLARAQRRRARGAMPQSADPDRRIPDVRRTRRSRPRGYRAGSEGSGRARLPPLSHPIHGVPRRGARPCRRADREAGGRPRRVHRRAGDASAHRAARLPRSVAGGRAVRGGRDP